MRYEDCKKCPKEFCEDYQTCIKILQRISILDNYLFYIFTPCDSNKTRRKDNVNKFIVQMRIGPMVDLCCDTFTDVCDYALNHSDIQLEYLIKFMQYKIKYIEENKND